MCEVVRSNFWKVLPQMKEKLTACSFVVIDLEFTGLSASDTHECSLFDDMEKRYVKVRRSVSQFSVTQIGLSIFTNDHWHNRYISHSYNFYIFPQTFGDSDTRFAAQASSMEFLAGHGFDFNKWVYEGIPYLDSVAEAELQGELEAYEEPFREAIERQINEAVGFSHVFKLIAGCKKPVVGHNMLLDLMFLYDKFHKPLPASYGQLKEEIHHLFPVIFDTKHVVLSLRRLLRDTNFLQRTSLQELYDAVTGENLALQASHSPKIEHAPESQIYAEEKRPHQAGFDAHAAGVVLIRVCHSAAMEGIKATDCQPVNWAHYNQLLSPYCNCVNVARAKLPYINFAGPDPLPNRPEWFQVTLRNKRRRLTQKEVLDAFGVFGSVDVEMCSRCAAIVAFLDFRGVTRMLDEFEEDDVFVIAPFSERHSLSPAMICGGVAIASIIVGAVWWSVR